MDTNYANAGGGGAGGGGGGHAAGVAIGLGAGVSARYSANYYKEPAASCQRSMSCNAYEPYGGIGTSVRPSSAYPYDADAEFKERTGMGKSKSSHLTMSSLGAGKLQQHTYNVNNCYGTLGQNVSALAPESANYYAYAYNQHHPYPQQQQQQQPYHHQSQLEQQYKYNMTAKSGEQQQQQQQTHVRHQQQQQQQSAVNAIKMSTPEYGYAPYRLQHPYYHPHYHHALSQKGGVGMMKTIPDANAAPYASSKMAHSTGVGGARVAQYQANYSYHPHGYPAAVSAGHHTYQSQSVCDDSRWMWNGGSGGDYQSSCRSAYPAYANSSLAKQGTMWPTMPMQYPNSMSTGYPSAAAVTNQSCCPPAQGAGNYYSQQYVKHQMQSISNAMNYDGGTNDLYSSNPQANSALPPATAQAKVYTDLNAQPQENSYQSMTAPSYHQAGNCNAPTALDYNSRYLQQQQQQTSLPPSSSSATAPYSHHYYHNLHPYAHQTYGASDNQESLYSQQQGDTKIGVTTKSQSLRDFLTSWNEDEDECSDRTMISTDAPFMEPMHLSSDYYTPPQEQQHNGAKSSPIVENHLQFKGSFTTRPKIHVGITVDSTVEPDQYINLPDIIIDIEKSNKDVVSIPEDILVTTVPKIEKEDVPIKEEKPEETAEPKPTATAEQPTAAKKKLRRKFLRRRRLGRQQKLRLIQRNQRKSQVCRKSQRPTTGRTKKRRESLNPQSLKCLCVSLLNSDKFRNRVLGQSEIDNLINLTTDNEVKIDVAAALGHTITSSGDTSSPPTSTVPASDIPKLSDLCKNALNSSFDRDVLVINLDEILDSDSLFVVQCDINENILENFVDDNDQATNNSTGTNTNTNTNTDDITHDDLVEILNDNNNNYDSGTGSGNYIPTAVTTNPIGIPASNVVATATAIATATATATAAATNEKAVTSAIKKRKRCCSVTEVSNLPLGNAVEHNNSNSTNTIRTASKNPLESHSSPSPQSMSPSLNSPCSRSCPAALCGGPPSSLIEQNCPTQQITVGHEQLHEMLVLSGIVHDDVLQNDDQPQNDTATTTDDSELLMLVSAVGTPSIHHEEIVPDNLKKFQNEKFLKYLHAKYVQGSLSEFYHANRIIKKYKKRIIKKILNIVR